MGSSAVTGLVVVAAVIVLATAFGVWRSRRDGQFRPVTRRGPASPTPAVGSTAAAGGRPAVGRPSAGNGTPATGHVPATGDGSATEHLPAAGGSPATGQPPVAAGTSAAPPATGAVAGTLAALRVDPGTPVTLLQFSSAFCAPCRATRRVLADVAATVEGVAHVEVDAESHLDAVRTLDIWRTPTTLVVARGEVVHRAGGVPTKGQVLAAVAALLDDARAA